MQPVRLGSVTAPRSAAPEVGETHRVRAGETLSGIAAAHGVELAALRAANPNVTDPRRLQIGQVLRIPSRDAQGAKRADAPATADAPTAPTASQRAASTAPRSTSGVLNGGLSPETLRARLASTTGEAAAPERTSLARFPDGRHSGNAARASWAEAKADERAMAEYKPAIMQVAREKGLDPALLAGVVSRETRAGALLDADGLGDSGHGHGLMQIDDRSFGPWLRRHDWNDPLTNIRKGADVLLDMKDEVEQRAKDNGLTPTTDQLLTWTVSAYNGGGAGAIWGVLDHGRSDAYTTGGNYAADVLARAQYYRTHGYRMPQDAAAA